MLFISKHDTEEISNENVELNQESLLKKDLLELEGLCADLANYVEKQDCDMQSVEDNVFDAMTSVESAASEINVCKNSVKAHRSKAMIGMGIGSVIGLLSTGSLLIAPAIGIAAGVIGYQLPDFNIIKN